MLVATQIPTNHLRLTLAAKDEARKNTDKHEPRKNAEEHGFSLFGECQEFCV